MDSFADVVREAQTATQGQKEELKRVLGWEQPSTKTRNSLWSVIVWAAVIILVGSFIVVGWEVHSGNAAIKPDWLLTMFTGILGFLTGLLVPSPVSKEDNP
jgi:hypothetical protein